MNIAMFSRVLFLSGVTTHIIDLSNELIKKGNKVFIFTSGPQYPDNEANVRLMKRLEQIGAIIILIPFPTNHNSKISYGFNLLRSIPIVRKELKRNKIDVLHIHKPALTLVPIILRKKFIKTVHLGDLSSLSFLNRKATHEITISRETYKKSKDKFDYNNNEISLIFNGVDESFSILADNDQKNKIKEDKSIPSNKIIIGLVGSIQFRKGHDILIQALSKLPHEIKNKIHILILGDGNVKDIDWLQNLLTSNFMSDITSRFSFQDPKPFYDIIDIFVLPSRLEGFPLVTLEAFLSGCCVIRSNVEGSYDQIEHNKNGFLFENESVEDLSSILLKLIEDDNKRKNVANTGRSYALKKFTSDIMADKTLKVYNKVVASK